MELRSNTERLAIRFAPYIQELREFFKSRRLHFGSPEDLGPLVEGLGSPGSFHDEMTSMLRSIIFRERGVMPRNELLELILVAIGGAEIDQAAQGVVALTGAVYEYVGEVVHSLKKKSFVEDDADIEEGDSLTEPLAESQTYSAQDDREPFAASREEVHLAHEAEWNAEATSGRQAEPRALAGAFTRAQRISPNFEEPVAKQDSRSLPPRPKTLEASELAVLHHAPVAPPPQHYFRNTMGVLFFSLAAVLFWRHWDPVPFGETPKQTHPAMAADLAPLVPGSLVGQTSSAHDPASNQASMTRGSAQRPAPLTKPAEAQPSVGSTPAMDARGGIGNPPVGGTPAVAPPFDPAGGSRSSAGSNGSPPSRSRRRSRRSPQPNVGQTAAVVAPTATTKRGGFLVSSGMMDGNLLTSPAPRYPKMASMAGVEGQVILQAVVSRNGTVVATHVLEGHHLLRGAATHAVRGWRYRPYMVNGKPTDVATIVIVDFHLPHP